MDSIHLFPVFFGLFRAISAVFLVEFRIGMEDHFSLKVCGFIIALMGCYHGFHSKGGAQGVGRATTNAVVSAAILILAANFALTSLLFSD